MNFETFIVPGVIVGAIVFALLIAMWLFSSTISKFRLIRRQYFPDANANCPTGVLSVIDWSKAAPH
jgi:hypothetical protein